MSSSETERSRKSEDMHVSSQAVGRVPAPPGKLADPSQFWKAAAAKAALDLKQQGWAVVEGVIPR